MPDLIVAVSVTSVSLEAFVTFPSFDMISVLLEAHVIVVLLKPFVGRVMSEVVFAGIGQL